MYFNSEYDYANLKAMAGPEPEKCLILLACVCDEWPEDQWKEVAEIASASYKEG